MKFRIATSMLLLSLAMVCACAIRNPAVANKRTTIDTSTETYKAIVTRFRMAYDPDKGFHLVVVCRAKLPTADPAYQWVMLEQTTVSTLLKIQKESPQWFDELSTLFVKRATADQQLNPKQGVYPSVAYGFTVVEELLLQQRFILHTALDSIERQPAVYIPPQLNETQPNNPFFYGFSNKHRELHVPLAVCAWDKITITGDSLDVFAHQVLMGRVTEHQDLASKAYQRRIDRLLRVFWQDYPATNMPQDLFQREKALAWRMRALQERAVAAQIPTFIQSARASLEDRGISYSTLSASRAIARR